MYPFESETFLQRVTLALEKPIQCRCRELTFLFQEASIIDLQSLFPLLIDKIFEPQGTAAWDLLKISEKQKPGDFQALKNFFSPMGPLFKVIYSVIKDPMMKYDFSIAYLPMKIRKLLDDGCMHPFYSDLVLVNPQNKQIFSLVLNPFDYYMFHFAYYLINPSHNQNDISLGSVRNTIYYALCYDYMIHFFPTDSNPVPPPVGVGDKLRMVQQPTFSQQLSSSNPLQSKLLKKDFFNDLIGEYSQLHPPLDKHSRAKIWRSESVLTIFLDMWLNNDQVSHINESFNMDLTTERLQFPVNEVPTGEYVRIVRDLVRRLHIFAASAKIDDGHMAELKRITLPIMQGKIYIFLRNLIHRWPLDGSFRPVLELWLTFVQPWRYVTLSRHQQQQPQTSSETNLNSDNIHSSTSDIHLFASKSVDREYLPFIAENILAYVVIFQQLLPRFLRVDLWSPKNSLMLYRLAKVFNQPNLVSLIKEIESCIEENNITQNHNYSYEDVDASMPPLSPTSNWSTNRSYQSTSNATCCDTPKKQQVFGNKYAMIVKQKIQELEGPSFQYKPLFISHPAPEVYELLKHIQQSKVIAFDTINQRDNEHKRLTSGIFGFLKSMFLDSTEDEFTIEDRKKVPNYLKFAAQYLRDMFDIQEDVISETVRSEPSKTSKTEVYNIISKLLAPANVRQRIYSIKYEGDPELMSIRSDEVTILVKMFYDLASKINREYGEQIHKLYENPTFLGRLSRQIISPPITIFWYDKLHFGHPRRIAKKLPPRISLRYFASYQFLVYISIGIVISVYMHYSILTFLFCIFAGWFCIICIKAIFDKSEIQQSPHPNPVENDSFDNSF